MFNWFKKSAVIAKVAPELEATTTQKNGSITPLAISESEALKNQGNVHFDNGKLDEAAECYRSAITRNPRYAEAYTNLGHVFLAQGNLDEAVALYRKAVEFKPNLLMAHLNLGIALVNLGQADAAEESFRQAVAFAPEHAVAWQNLGVIAARRGDFPQAETLLRRALELKPDYAQTHYNLGNALQGLGQLDGAEASYRRALEIKPDYAKAHCNLGNVLQELGQLDDAVASCRRALEIKADLTEAHYNLGNALQALGQLDGAVESYRRALEIKPDFAEAHSNLGNAMKDIGQFDDAVASYRRALEVKPDYTEAHYNLGNALKDLGQFDDAVASYHRALELKPDYVEAHCNLGNTLMDMGRRAEAEASFRRALKFKPDSAEAHSNLGNPLRDMGRLDEAEASYQRALQIKPDFANAYSNLLFLHSYHALINPNEYLSLARGWEQACVPAQDRQLAHDKTFQRMPLTGRRLKVGYVSGDYRQHAVSYFIEQLFARHDRGRIDLFAYSNSSVRDVITERLQSFVDHWVSIVRMSDTEVLDRIEADDIDVLIDLSGHTRHTALSVFARRAAPVQAHYLGFMASTGLTEMDYWIGDEILTPPETDSHFSEHIWRLPRVWVSYDGKADAPVQNWRPSQDGAIWMGSFNNLGKLTPATLALWAQVLHAVPEGKLLLKTKELSVASNRQRILDAMSGHGILPERIELQDSGATPGWPAHMAYYDRLDIALDPVGGVGGGTTTCDALWMGVPVIALEGDRMASRMTASMLNAIGRPEWIARFEAEYIDKVVALAREVEQRNALRSGQRDRMAASPLCDARGLAMSLENAYFAMFQRWQDKKINKICIAK